MKSELTIAVEGLKIVKGWAKKVGMKDSPKFRAFIRHKEDRVIRAFNRSN